MCKESLKAYIISNDEKQYSNNELANRTIDRIIQQQELESDEKQYAEKNAFKIICCFWNKVTISNPPLKYFIKKRIIYFGILFN